ncbi:MAG: SDR family oxidoreductase [Acidobacteria bacterium]|nr:SDR family oxidoreductase [Acidobacteriota bacterium]
MDLGIRGKTALVGGSSGGIGRAIAEGLAAEGANVAVCSRSAGAARKAADEIARRHGVRTTAIECDLSEPAGATTFVAGARAALGAVSILVTNSGGPPTGVFRTTDDAAWERGHHVTLMSAVRLIRECLPDMTRARWGRIVNIASISVRQPIDGLLLSNALRAAVVGMAKTLSREIGPEGVLVNTVCPGYTQTPRLAEVAEIDASSRGISPEAVVAGWVEGTPLRRVGTPEEIAAVAVFLCSGPASYVTGTTICVDGGRVAGLP